MTRAQALQPARLHGWEAGMAIRSLFATPFYEGEVADAALLAELSHSCRVLAAEDAAGRRWSRNNRYPGYTSYASLNDLPARDPAFAVLARRLMPHARAFCEAAHMDLAGRKLRLDSLWVNILKPRGSHSGHIHPHSLVSGTVYVEVPDGAGPLKLEDPRLPLMMAAPPRRANAPDWARPFIYAESKPGTLFLWESWLRHEVPPGRARSERISISFNFA
jgi:uncharacterized protein (TIGR02466 family)